MDKSAIAEDTRLKNTIIFGLEDWKKKKLSIKKQSMMWDVLPISFNTSNRGID